MIQKAGKAALVISLITLGGCASVVKGGAQDVVVDTPNCPIASCTLRNSQGVYYAAKTPQMIRVYRASEPLSMACEKAGVTIHSKHQSQRNAVGYGNIALAGLPGLMVDGFSEAGFSYPDQLINPLNCSGYSQTTQQPTGPMGLPRAYTSAAPTMTDEERIEAIKYLKEKGIITF